MLAELAHKIGNGVAEIPLKITSGYLIESTRDRDRNGRITKWRKKMRGEEKKRLKRVG